jgi:hypothetical protein
MQQSRLALSPFSKNSFSSARLSIESSFDAVANGFPVGFVYDRAAYAALIIPFSLRLGLPPALIMEHGNFDLI